MKLKILLVDGNPKARNDAMRAVGGDLGAARHEIEIGRMFPDVEMPTIYPADPDGGLPAGVSLGDFDGMVLGGSGLHAADNTPEVRRQVDLMRAALDTGLSVLGSCWGLQIAAVAAGGTVAACARGREVGFARKLTLTPEGRAHPFFKEKPAVFDSPCIHYDEVTHLPPGAVVLAANAHSAVQAAEIRVGNGVFWGVQYHPEFDLRHIGNIYRRYADAMIEDGYFDGRAALDTHVGALNALHADPARRDLRLQLGLDDDVLNADIRYREVGNWVESLIARRGAR